MNGHHGGDRRQVQSPEVEFYVFGHPCYAAPEDNPPELDYIVWRYSDTGELVEDTLRRKCPRCGQYPTRRGHDPCIRDLPDIKAACCGHGVEDGYVVFANGITIRGKFDHITRQG